MSPAVRQLEPRALWNHFADLNQVPRPSKKEERVIGFIRDFGESLSLETVVDSVGNVIIRKKASPGMEDRCPVVMQSHLDMVCQKNEITDFDFDTQAINMIVEGDWVKAVGTTLGADNGIGVASMMTILASSDIPHPPVEGLFTVDEETGMTGAQELQGGLLRGQILLNLDTEEDNELTIGCAGGVDVTCEGSYEELPPPVDSQGIRITVRGLTGGHSGVDIHLGRGNANKWMNRLLWRGAQQFEIRVAQIDGGGLRNAIPRESSALVAVKRDAAESFAEWVNDEFALIRAEHDTTDPDAELVVKSVDTPKSALPADLQTSLLAAIYGVVSGIHRMSPEIEGLVQTSNNLARVDVADGRICIGCLTRSSVDSERDDLAEGLCAVLGQTGAAARLSGVYPGWQPNRQSSIVTTMSRLYEEMFGEPPNVGACHAGLECGILGRNYPGMDMVSFGPNIYGAHSPDERVQITSVQKYWSFLLETLRCIPRL